MNENTETGSNQTTYPLYPDVSVELIGQDGNAFAVMGRVSGALREAGVPESAFAEFQNEAMSGDYENLLRTVQKWVHVQ